VGGGSSSERKVKELTQGEAQFAAYRTPLTATCAQRLTRSLKIQM